MHARIERTPRHDFQAHREKCVKMAVPETEYMRKFEFQNFQPRASAMMKSRNTRTRLEFFSSEG